MNKELFPTDNEIREQIFSECRALQFIAKKWADTKVSGAYKSIQKGSGIEFEEARLYSPGDDARRIDWKLSAKRQKPYIKSFREERDQSLHLIVDVSPSTLLGVDSPKIRKIGEICAFLSSIAIFNKDSVGGATFFDKIIKYNPPKKGLSSAFSMLHSVYSSAYKLYSDNNISTTPSLHLPLLTSSSIIKKKSAIFIVSDFNFPLDFSSALQGLAKRHDVYAIRLSDSLEKSLPNSGKFLFFDPESRKEFLLDLSSKKTRESIISQISIHSSGIERLFAENGIPYVSFYSSDNIRTGLFNFFQKIGGRING